MPAATIFDSVLTAVAPVVAIISFGPWPSLVIPGLLVASALLAWQVFTLRRKVRELTDRDPLTGVASRTGFLAALNRAVLQHFPANGGVSVAILDCDDFKQINEQFGHQGGDTVLIEVARILAQVVATSGTVGRIWGDAFGIFLPNVSEDSARDLLARAQECLQLQMGRHGWPLTFSIGVSSLSGSNATAETLLGDADRLMFMVKRRGRNGIAARGQFSETNAATGQPRDPLANPKFARQP
ncbi:MAG TPA: GGDEF domain-containing protein [Planctomycetaceae bacterium]|jgi:diguanylate cyclase (GGDEF)-like protein|nr:GGDEF domain-containing protein [Planctomycetaceae bacterium]